MMPADDRATWADYVAVWERHGEQDAWRFARDNLTGADLDAARRRHESTDRPELAA